MGLNHKASMLSTEGLKTFVFVHRNSFPNILNRGSVYEIYCLWPIWPRQVNKALIGYSWFSRGVAAAVLVSPDNETVAMLEPPPNPLGIELYYYTNVFFCFC